MILASSAATLCSSYVWGRLADQSSRKVLLFSGLAAGITLGLTVLASLFNWINLPWILPAFLFGLMIAYQGVRIGRSTHLVDMADESTRSTYTALSNSIIGILVLVGGTFSLVAQDYGETLVLGIFCIMSFAAAVCAFRLKEVQSTQA